MNKKRFRARTKYDLEKSKKRDNFIFLNKSCCLENQIVLAGDSITEIFNMDLFNHYMLENNIHIYNRGISGDTSDRFLERFEETVLDLKPKCLVILIGTNDLTLIDDVEYVFNNIKECVIHASSLCEKIIIESVFPVDYKQVKKNKRIKELNEKLKSLCSGNIEYLDLYTDLLDSKGGFNTKYTYDGLHPNAQGFKLIADKLINKF